MAKTEANAVEYDDERYDVIKEDQESGESTQLETFNVTPSDGHMNESFDPVPPNGTIDHEMHRNEPLDHSVAQTNSLETEAENYSAVAVSPNDSIESEAEHYNFSIRPSISIISP